MGKLVNIEDIVKDIGNKKNMYMVFVVATPTNTPLTYVTQCDGVKIKLSPWEYVRDVYVEPKHIKEYVGVSKIVSFNLSFTVEDNGNYITLEKDSDSHITLAKYITFDIGTTIKLVWKMFYDLYRNSEVKYPRDKLIVDYKIIKEKIKQTFKDI